MQKSSIISSTEAAAHGARLSCVDVVCVNPTPLSINISKELKMPTIETDSLSAALNAAIGAELGGKRAFVTSSLYPAEDMYTTSYFRIPAVLSCVSYSPGTFSIKHDHNAIMSARDCGWLIFMPESNQELIDMTIQAYKICEDPKVLLPALIGIDLPHLYEPVMLPSDKLIKQYVSKFKLPIQIDGKKLYYVGVPDIDYSEMKKQQHKAMENAIEVIEKTSLVWKKKIGRIFNLTENYKTDDADYILVMSGFHSQTAKAAINKLRSEGKKVGLLRISVIRPWPAAQVDNALKKAKKVAVFDQSISPGSAGCLYADISRHTKASNFISLGKHPSEKDFTDIFERLVKTDKEELVWL